MSRSLRFITVICLLAMVIACRPATTISEPNRKEASAPATFGKAADHGFHAAFEQEEVDDDEIEDWDEYKADPVKLLLMKRGPDGSSEVLRRESKFSACGDVEVEITDIEGAEESPLKMWQLVCMNGEDFASAMSLTVLVRLGADKVEVLWEGQGRSTNAMDVCDSADIINFVLSEDGRSVDVFKVAWTEMTERDFEHTIECEPREFQRELVTTFPL